MKRVKIIKIDGNYLKTIISIKTESNNLTLSEMQDKSDEVLDEIFKGLLNIFVARKIKIKSN